MEMHKLILILFLKVLFIREGASNHPVLRSLRDSLNELGDADAKYKKAIYNYINFKTKNNLNNRDLLLLIPIDRYKLNKKKIARLSHNIQKKIDEQRSIIVQREHEARMKEIIDFMKDHMLTTKYLHEEVQRIKRTRQVKDTLREMVTFLEDPDRLNTKNMFLNMYAYALKHHTREEPNIWDQKMNDMVINVMKDPFNDGVIN